MKIDSGPIDVHHRPLIDNHLESVLFCHNIFGLIEVFIQAKVILEAATTCFLKPMKIMGL